MNKLSSLAFDVDDRDGGSQTISSGITIAQRRNDFALKFDNFRRIYDAQPSDKWKEKVVDNLVEFFRLAPGWDGYDGKPLRLEIGMFTLTVLHQVMMPRVPVPQVVPLGSGGVQLEWHEKGIDLEFTVFEPYVCEVFFEDSMGELPSQCANLGSDFSSLQGFLRLLAER